MSTFQEKMSAIMQGVGHIVKDGFNEFHKYRYASAEAVLTKVRQVACEQGLFLETDSEIKHYQPGHAVVKVTLVFTDGENRCTIRGHGEGADKGDKAMAKANTCAVKYALASGFLVSWGDDPEADRSVDKAGDVDVTPYVAKITKCANIAELNKVADEFEEFISTTFVTKPVMSKFQKAYDAQKKKFS